ncbi:MAG TPA: D-aminoacyl-tRNA deacylase [Actinomycetota bacterium]|nr:D-aminoacyl-tRNA deacylase [Actinomycetota bacterium]
MRGVVQRVTTAKVTVDGAVVGKIGLGLLLLVGITKTDGLDECEWLADKVINLRIFGDDEGKMNRSLVDVGGSVLVVSQFTLYGDARKSRRPSFIDALAGDRAENLYDQLVSEFEHRGIATQTGRFGAMMDVTLTNEGPVTILLDSSKLF